MVLIDVVFGDFDDVHECTQRGPIQKAIFVKGKEESLESQS